MVTSTSEIPAVKRHRLVVPMRYHLLTYRREQLWLPAALWTLFVLLVGVFGNPNNRLDMASSFLGVVLPLVAGLLASSALLDDPALELQFTSPRPAWTILGERLGMLLGITAIAAVSYQIVLLALGLDMSPYGNLAARQLLWLVPSLALMGLGTGVALGSAQAMAGALAAGLIWLAELILRGWFASHQVARYLFLFMGAIAPRSPYLLANRICLCVLAGGMAFVAILLLRREERYL